MMVYGQDFFDGDILWYCRIGFSSKTFRVMCREFPVEIKVRGISSGGSIQLVDPKNEDKILFILPYPNRNFENMLFKTEEDCRQYWKSCFIYQLDKLQSVYDKARKYLENYMKRKK